MQWARQFAALRCAAACGVLALLPSTAVASQHGPSSEAMILTLAAVGGNALLLGAVTSAVVVWLTRRNWAWFLVPVFAIAWLAAFALLRFLWMRHY